MTKIKIKDIYKFILKVLPVTPGGDLLAEVEGGKKVVLIPTEKKGIVGKTAGILKWKIKGIKYEDKLRKQEEMRIKREASK